MEVEQSASLRDLFGTVRLVPNCGRIGVNGQEKVEEFAGEVEVIVSAIFSKQNGPGYPGPLRLQLLRQS